MYRRRQRQACRWIANGAVQDHGAEGRRRASSSPRIVYNGPVPAPVKKGQPIGALKVWRGDNLVLEVPLKRPRASRRATCPQRAFDAVTELVIDLFRAGAERL